MSTTETPSETAPEPTIYARTDHGIPRGKFDEDALGILYRLNRAGFKAYIVGGGVRDLLLNKRPKDFDIATDAHSGEIKALFRNSRVIGKRYKLVHIFFAGGKNIEVSTFRDVGVPVDPNTVSEDAAPIVTRENTFGTESTDAIRRDLTINALFYDLSTGSIRDYVGGVRDLKEKLIRIIGEPDVRFAEDPVRMLRVARHQARNNFTIEENTKKSVIKNFHLIARASPVRVFDEIRKDLTYGYSLPTIRAMAELRLLEPLIPELLQREAVLLSDISEFSHCLAKADEMARAGKTISSSSVLALMLLFMQGLKSQRRDIYSWFTDRHEILDASQSFFKYLAVPKKERERIANVLSLWHELGAPPFNKARLQSLRRAHGIEDLPLLVEFMSDEEDAAPLQRLAQAYIDNRPPRGAGGGDRGRRGGGRRRGGGSGAQGEGNR